MEVGRAVPRFGAGRFEVRGTLGAGGAGVVYRVFDHQLRREVALKLLRRASGRDLYRFKREFRALADLAHPSLVTLHELHASDGAWYFTMELVEGVSFIDRVRPPLAATSGGPQRTRGDVLQGRLDEPNLRGALVQLADALLALHDAGVLHRDLKPSNVLVTAEGRLALLDFGLVLALAEDVPERLAVGTPVYMSPEQAADQPLDEASDWYSVGAMLYEALAGRRPIEGEPEDVMTRKQTELPRHPGEHAPHLPDDLARLALALLEPDPARRPRGREVLERLGTTPSRAPRARSRSLAPPALVGRDRELAELATVFADARRRGTCVMVRGRSGIGKTALVRAFLRGLGDTAFILEGRCFEREAVPFKMLDGVVDELTTALVGLPGADIAALDDSKPNIGALVRMFPVLRRVPRFADLAAQAAPPPDPQEVRRRGFEALRGVLAGLARQKPVVIFVDDVHWGDADSAVFFAELIVAAEPSTMIVLAHRPEDYLGIVARLRRDPSVGGRRNDARELEVTALADPDTRALVEQLGGDPERAETIVRAAGGNPYVVTELACAPALAGSMKVDDLVAARVARLSPDAQAMLAVASVAGRPIAVEIAAQAAGVVGGHDQASQLSAERLATVRRAGGQMILHPAHDYVRVAVVASLDAEARAGWHEALARAFEDAHADGDAQLDSQAVVEHWLAAGHPANAAHHAVSAAQRAEDALAFRRAAELYEIAVAFGPWDVAGQRDLLRKKAHALACAGQLDEAARVYGHAAEILADDESIDLERLRVEALLRRGRLDEALPAAEHLLAQVGVRVPLHGRTSRTRLATQWVQMKLRGLDFTWRHATSVPTLQLRKIDVLYSIASGLAFADPALGRVVQAELRRAALDAGEPVRVCLALAQEMVYAAAAGTRNRAAIDATGARLDAIARRVAEPYVIGLADTANGIAAYMRGGWRDARARFDTGLATLRDHGVGASWELDVGETYAVGARYYLGEWRELARLHGALLRDAIDRDDVVAQQGLRTGRSVFAWLVQGRPDEARRQLAAAEATLASGFHLPHVLAVQAAANIDLYAGDAATARARLDDAWPQLERIGALRIHHLRVELTALRARLAIAHGRDTRFAHAAASELLGEGATWATGLGQLTRASALAADGDHEAALGELIAADDALVAAQMIGFLHVARVRQGELEGGSRGAARSDAARDLLVDIGASDPRAMCALLLPWPA